MITGILLAWDMRFEFVEFVLPNQSLTRFSRTLTDYF